jgi:hypothetical protein
MVSLKERFAYKTATLRGGRFTFNQVVYEHSDVTPERVVLIGWDADRGVFIWSPSGSDAATHATTQASGYSMDLHGVDPDSPPAWLGPPDHVTRGEMEAAASWPSLHGLAPHRKRTAILEAISNVRSELFD